jgi:hypothetical protein
MRFLPLFLFCGVLAVLTPAVSVHAQETLQACCTCQKSGQTGTTSCVNVDQGEGGSNCGALPGKYPNLVGYTCTAPPSGVQCTSKASSASGICNDGPVNVKAFSPSSGSPQQIPFVQPTLNVAIPGLVFSTAVTTKGGTVTVPFFAQYVAAIYRYLIGIAAVAAAVMLVYGGFLYIVAQTGAKVRQGKDIITDALIGLALVLGAYIILNTVNPAVLNLKPLEIGAVAPTTTNLGK